MKGLGRVFDPAEVDEGRLREAWRHRARFMDLKPGVDPEVDFGAFCKVVRGCFLGWELRDGGGGLLGTCYVGLKEYEAEGRPFVWVVLEYLFIEPKWRKTLGYPLAVLWGLARIFARAKGRPVFAGGAGYPPSFLALGVCSERVWFRADEPEMPAWERAARDVVAGEMATWERASNLVVMRTMPKEPRLTPPSDPRLVPLWEGYREAAPDWQRGVVPFAFGRLEPRVLLGRLWPELRRRVVGMFSVRVREPSAVR